MKFTSDLWLRKPAFNKAINLASKQAVGLIGAFENWHPTLDYSARCGHAAAFGSATFVQTERGPAISGVSTSGTTGFTIPARSTPAVTYAAWIKARTFTNAYEGIISKSEAAGVEVTTLLVKSNGKLAPYLLATSTVSYDGTGAFTLSTGVWYHVAMTYDSVSGLVGYVNGFVDNTAAANGAINTTTPQNIGIGWQNIVPTPNRGFDGLIADARIYDRALSSEEIQELVYRPNQLFLPRNKVIFDYRVPATDQTVTPAAGSIIVAGSAPTVKQNILRQPTVGSVVVAGSAPTVKQNILRQPTVGSVVVTGNAPTLVTNTLRQPATGSVIVAGNAPAVVTGGNAVVNPNTGTIVVSGLAPTLKVNTIRQPAAGSVVVAGNAPTLGVDQTARPAAGSIIVAGNAPTVSYTSHVVRNPDAGQIIVSGLTPTVINSGLLSAQQLAELYGGNIFSTRKKKKKKEKPPLEEMVFQISKSPEGKKEIIKALPKPIQEELPDPQLALVSDLINKIEDASARVQKKVEQIYRKRIDDDDEDDVFILLL